MGSGTTTGGEEPVRRTFPTFVRPGLAVACAMALWAGVPNPASAEDVFQLISPDEAALPTDDVYSRGITRGPRIVQVSPPPESGQLQSPVRLVIRFKGRGGAAIDPETLVVTYKKRPPIDLTRRIEPFITADGIDIEDAGMPPGHHRIEVSIKDERGREGNLDFTIDVRD